MSTIRRTRKGPIPPTNQVGIKSFLLRKWTDNSDTTWAFNPNDDINQKWPMSEQLRYTNTKLRTAAMGGFPLGDLWRWWGSFPTTYSGWKAQAATECANITAMLTNGVTAVDEDASLSAGVLAGSELSDPSTRPRRSRTRSPRAAM